MKLKSITIYFPSFLSRYSIQLMLIALPWIMSDRHASAYDISLALAGFYAASLLQLWVTGPILSGRNTSNCLRVILALLGLVCTAALYVESTVALITLRALQGALTGILRPLNQIWLLQMSETLDCPVRKAQQAAQSQVFIACGTVLGAFLGATLGASFVAVQDSPITSVSIEYGLLMALCGLPPLVGALLTPSTDHRVQLSPFIGDNIKILANNAQLLLQFPSMLTVIVCYVLNMTVFKIWTISYPMAFRLESSNYQTILPIIITLSPFCFLFGQMVMARVPHLLRSDKIAAKLVAGSALIQAFLIPIAVMLPTWKVSTAIICIVGGFASAIIYPSMQRVILSETTGQSAASRQGLQLVISAGADVGQIVGAGILAFATTGDAAATAIFAMGLITLVFIWHGRRRQVSSIFEI